jgi:hypothetical protein
MALEIKWVVEQMSCYPEKDGETDVVFTVHWRVNGSDGPYYGTNYGTQGMTYEAGNPFTPYEDLTQDQVIGWVKDAMGEERVVEIESNVAKQIENQKNPPVVSPPLPWASTPLS